MSCIDLCRRVLLGIALASSYAVFAAAPIVNLDATGDFTDVTADLMFQDAQSDTTEPDPARFRSVLSNRHELEKYNAGYWFKLELDNDGTVPIRRLLELTHTRLGLIVARIQSKGTDRQLLRTGAGMDPSTRAVSFPNAVIPFDVAPMSRATLLIFASSRDNMVLSARLWSDSGFSTHQLRHDLIVGAGLGALLVLAIYNLVVFMITRRANYARLSALLLAILFWQFIGLGYADLMLHGGTSLLMATALPAAMPLFLLALLVFGRGFLAIDPASRIGRAIRVFEILSAVSVALLFVWPEPRLFLTLSVVLIPSALLLLGHAVVAVRARDANARRFLIATTPLIVTMLLTATARIVGSSFEVGTAQSLILLSSVFFGVILAIALAQHMQVLSSDRRDAHHAALIAKLRAKESELKAVSPSRTIAPKRRFLPR